MESPVMTSASSHRLRSAVSACAQPTHSYLNSSYLSISIQVESQNSGGCLKKFYNSGKTGESSPLNITKKSRSSNDFSSPHKRYKTCTKNGLSHCDRAKSNGKEVESSADRGVLSLIPKRFMIGNELLSKLKHNKHFLDSSKLAEYHDKSPGNQSVGNNCEKVINGKSGLKSIKKNTSDGNSNNNNNNNNKILNSGQNKVKSKKRARIGKKDSINGEGEPSDECSKCSVAPNADAEESREVSKWQPKHVVTKDSRRTVHIVRGIINACQSTVEPSKTVPRVCEEHHLNDSQFFSSPTQVPVSRMLEYASENTGIANDLIRIKTKLENKCRVTSASPVPRIPDRNEENRSRKFSKGMSKYEVFLGGSCNPTTWRTDLAIPELEKMGISYFNPQQVEKWRPELMEVEYHAKENATVMFFVLDNQTRGVSALIEVAHLVGNRRKLILVVQSYTQKNQIICDEQISKEEYEDLKTGQEVLQDLVERQGIPVFDDIKVALKCTEKILRGNLTVQDLQGPVQARQDDLIGPRDVFEKLDGECSGEISTADSCLALKILTGIEVSPRDLRNFISKAGKDLNGTLSDESKLDYEHFSQLLTEFKRHAQEGAFLNLLSPSKFCCRDVYLGGTIENTSWRESVAIPALEEQNLSFFVPKVQEGGKRFTEVEAAAMDNSFVLLFAITNTARSIAAMAIAGHYIGKGANVVLCVEHLPEQATLAGETLSENAVKDYNRGRMYLKDIAERSGVPVFNDISMAVKCVTQKCTTR